MKRKLLSLVMIVMLIISTFSVPMIAGAASYIAEGTCGTNLTWTLDESGVLTVSGKGAMASYSDAKTVPWYSYLGNIKTIIVNDSVTTIGTNAFRDCPNLISVSLPDTLITIGYASFRGNTALKSIYIPDSVTTMSSYVFYECTALESVRFSPNLKTIGDFSFYLCKKLNNISLPEKLVTIGSSAFRGCSVLSSVEVPYSVTTINGGAFSYCLKLSEVTLYNNVKTIGNNAFASCGALKNVYYEGTESDWNVVSVGTGNEALTSNISFGKQDCISYGACGADAEWILGFDGTLTISGTGAMKSYSSSSDVPWLNYADQIISVVVEDGITSIGNWSFYLLKKVTSVSLPEGLVTMGSSAFRGCSSLTEVKIPSTVTNIGAAAFSYCSRLSTVYMYNKVKTIGSNAFISSNIADVYFEGKLNEWESINVSSGNDTLLKANIHIAQEEVILEKIEITKLPVFEDGKEPDFSDIVVMGTYSDGTVAEIKDYDVTVQPTVAGYLVTVSCGDISAQAEIKPTAPYVVKVEIAQMPDKTVYYVGEEIDLTGLIVRVYMSNDKTIDISKGFHVLDFDSSTPGIKKVTVGYESYTGQLEVEVIEKVIPERMEIDELPLKTTYYVGEELDLTGLAMCLVYSDGSRDGLLEEAIFEGFDSDTPGIKTITVISGEFTATFEVEVIKREPQTTGINIASYPSKTEFVMDEIIEFPDLVVNAVYDDGTEVQIYDYAITIPDTDTPGTKCVYIMYGDYEATFYIELIGRNPVDLIISSLPYKTVYEEGESLDLEGFAMSVMYSDGTIEEIFDYTISGYDLTMQGENIIEVWYGDLCTTFTVYVTGGVNPEPDPSFVPWLSILSYPYKVDYMLGEGIDLTGLEVEYWDEFGNSHQVMIGDLTISGFDSWSEGPKVVAIEYMGCIAGFDVFIQGEPTPPVPDFQPYINIYYDENFKTEYNYGEELDLTGLFVEYWDEWGVCIPLTEGEYSVFGFDPYIEGKQTVSVDYMGCAASFDVYVNPGAVPEPDYIVNVYVDMLPGKAVYNLNEELDLTGLRVVAIYNSGMEEEFYDYVVSEFDSSTPGTKTITLTAEGYEDFYVTFQVEVISPYLAEGECGEELTWTLDHDGLLTIDGYGDMFDYEYMESPWREYEYDIREVHIGKNTGKLDIAELSYLYSIESYSVDRKNQYYNTNDVCLYNKDKSELLLYPIGRGDTYYDVSETVTKIGSRAFAGSNLEEIYIPYGIEVIGNSVFENCYNITEIQFPETIREIGSHVFNNCTNLQYVSLGNGTGLTTIENFTFLGCENLNTVYIPISVTNIDNNAFRGCYNLTRVDYDGTIGMWREIKIGDNNEVLTNAQINCVRPNSIVVSELPVKLYYEIGEDLDLNGLKIFVNYVNHNGHYLYEDDYKVSELDSSTPGEKTITVSYGVHKTSFTVTVYGTPEPVVESIKIVSYPEKTTYEIGEAFDMEGLKVVAVYNDGTEEDVTNYITVDFAANVVGKNTVKIFYNEFSTSYEVEVIEKPLPTEGECGENVTWILNADGTLVIDGFGPMYDYHKNIEVPWYELRDEIFSVVIGDEVTTIGRMAFYGCTNIVNITMGKNVEIVGDFSFKNCENISTLTLGENVKHIGNSSFYNCKNITIISMGENIETIGDLAFYDCDGLTIITIADSIKSIGNRAFYDCDNVTHVEIGDSVESIGNYAFSGCGELETVVVGVSVSVVGNYAFDNCDKLSEVTYKGTHQDKENIQMGEGNESFDANTIVRELIEIVSNPHKTVYEIGETLDTAGLGVEVVYTNDKREVLADTDYEISTLDTSTPGHKTITISYKGLTTSFDVEVKEPENTSRLVTGTVYSAELDEPVFNAIVSFYDGDMLKAVTTTDMDGKYSVELPAAVYKVIVNSAIVDTFDMTMYPMATLYTCVVVSENGANQDFSVALPLYGDVNGDEFVDVNDVVEVKASYTDGYTSVDNEFNAEYEENWTVTGIRGTVYSPELEEYIPNALVYIYRGTSFISATLTDATGSYYFDVEPGEYTVMTYATVTDTFDMVSYQMLPAQSAVNVEDGMVNLSVNVYFPLYGDVNKDGIVDINDIVEVKASYTYNEAGVKQYKVFFETYGGSFVPSQMVDYNGYAQMPEEPYRPDCTFKGWFKDNAFGERYYFDTPVTEDITLYALWMQDDVNHGGSGGGGGYEEDPEWENAAVVTFEENSYAPAKIMNVWGRTADGKNINSLNKFTSWDEAEGVDRPDAEEDFGIGLIKIDSTVNPEIISGIYEGRMNPILDYYLEGGQTYRYSVWMYLDDTAFGEEDDTVKVTIRPYFGNSIGLGVKDAYVIEEITRGQWTKLQFEFFLPADQDGKETGFRFLFKETESGNYPTVIYMDNAKIQKYIG